MANEQPGFQSIEECIEVCQEALDASDQALDAANKEIAVQRGINELLESRLKEAAELNQELTERQGAWHRDPQTVGTISLVVGIVLGAWIRGQK